MKSPILSCSVTLIVSLGALSALYAASATWNINPTNDWNTPTNWTPNTVPNSPEDVATFAQTNMTLPVIHSDVELNTLFFAENAPAPITITVGDTSGEAVVSLTLSGTGIVNDTDYFQLYPQAVQAAPTLTTNGARNVIYLKNNATITNGDGNTATQLNAEGGTASGFVGGQIQFLDNSVAGVPIFGVGVNALAGLNGGEGGEIWFFDNSSAGYAEVTSGSGLYDAGSKPGITYFMGNSTADHAYLDNPPTQAPDTEGGRTFFLESSTAGDCIIYAGGGAYGAGAGGGTVIFSNTASAGNALLTAYGGISGGLDGSFQFLSDSTGGTAQVELNGTARLIISNHNPPGITIGSLIDGDPEGGGIVILGSNNLTVGSDNLTTQFSGVIEGSGSLNKIGTGTLALNGSSTYTGGTTIRGGVLKVTTREGSGTGAGPVDVHTGTLAGAGIIAGTVTVDRGGSVEPKGHSVYNLTIQEKLSFRRASTYSWRIDLIDVSAGQVSANGVTISRGAHLTPITTGNGTLAIGTTFLIISNTSANPIAGTFSNLPDGGIVNVNGNNLQASYEGGDGNDLTLTVVP